MKSLRARCIAHELLIVERYSKSLGATGDPAPNNDPAPTRHDEDSVLCPFEQIEAFLHTIEVEHQLSVTSPTDFIHIITHGSGKQYFELWQKTRCVDRHTATLRTLVYLSCLNRLQLWQNVGGMLIKVCVIMRIRTASRDTIARALRERDAFYRELVSLAQQLFGHFATERYVDWVLRRFLELQWQEFQSDINAAISELVNPEVAPQI
jgi:hypothetical protein